jgi:hypothetical protein
MLLSSRQRTLSIGLLLLHINIATHATSVIKGDSKSPEESFTHPIQKFIMNNHGLLYVGAITKADSTKITPGYEDANKSGAKNYALALVNIQNLDSKFSLPADEQGQQQEFLPAAPRKAIINGKKDTVNPIYNSHINHLAFMTQEIFQNRLSYVAAVTKERPASIYLLESIKADVAQMRFLENINDASGIKQTSSIAQLASGSMQSLYAAVTDNSSAHSFGEGNSGIAIVILQEQDKKTSQSKDKQESQKDASLSTEKKDQKENTEKEEPVDKFKLVQIDYSPSDTDAAHPRAIPLNNDSPFLRIGEPAIKILNNAVNIDWSPNLDNVYIALNIHAQGKATDGCQAIVIGYWGIVHVPVVKDKKTNNSKKTPQEKQTPETEEKKQDQHIIKHKFFLQSIALPSAFAPNVNNIVGGCGPDINVSIHQTKTMHTSTLFDYLVILGGIGTSERTKRSVYALPIVKNPGYYNGILAKKGSKLKTNYIANRLTERLFLEPAKQPGDLYTADDIEAQVGHGPMIEGDITSIMVYGDTVYAVVTLADADHTSGIYQSQAIFNSLGLIKEWTYWRRVYSSFTDYIYGASLNQATGTLVILTGTSPENIHTVKRTVWKNDPEGHSKNLANWLNSIFPSERGGIQGLHDIPVQTPGLKNISLVIATGYKQIALAQTGVRNETYGNLKPLTQNELASNPKHYTNGIITPDSYNSDGTIESDIYTNAIVISGGALDELNIIKTAAITSWDYAGYIFVGGTHGLAILLNDQGYSFDARKGIANNLLGLKNTEAIFKKIGAYSFIRKLICDHEAGLLYVISDTGLDRIDLKNSDFATDTIAVTRLVTYNDINNSIIFDAVISRSICILATSYGLYFSDTSANIRTAQNSTDLQWHYVDLPEGLPTTRQIYCVSATGLEEDITSYTGGNIYVLNTDQSKQKAQVYRFTVNTTIQDTIKIEPLPDYFIKDVPSYFVQLVGYRSWIYNDGSLFFNARSSMRFGMSSQSNVPIDLRTSSIIQPIVRSSASGSWLLAQDTIFSVNE